MILCLDLETTGLNQTTCGLFEIGACWLHGGEFSRACRPHSLAVIEKRALEVNGRTEEDAKDLSRLPEALAVSEFLGWARGPLGDQTKIQIAAWNAHFDHRHLMAAFERAGIEHCYQAFSHRLIDLHSLVAGDSLRRRLAGTPFPTGLRSLVGNEVVDSDTGSAILGLDPEPKPHNALTGARQVRAMLRRFLGDVGALA